MIITSCLQLFIFLQEISGRDLQAHIHIVSLFVHNKRAKLSYFNSFLTPTEIKIVFLKHVNKEASWKRKGSINQEKSWVECDKPASPTQIQSHTQ